MINFLYIKKQIERGNIRQDDIDGLFEFIDKLEAVTEAAGILIDIIEQEIGAIPDPDCPTEYLNLKTAVTKYREVITC